MSREATLVPGRAALMKAIMVGLELAWLFMLLYEASEALHIGVPIAPLLLVYAASLACSLAAHALIRAPRIAAAAVWAVWPVATFLLLLGMFRSFDQMASAPEAMAFVILAAGTLWWTASRLAVGRADHRSVLIRFQFGLLMLAGCLLVGYLTGVDQTPALSVAVAFVALGLAAAAVTRSEVRAGPRTARRGGAWWGMLLAGLCLVLVLGVVAGILFTPEFMHLLVRGLRGLWALVDRLLDALRSLLPSSCSDESEELLTSSTQTTLPSEAGQRSSLGLPARFWRFLDYLWAVLVVGALLAAIWSIASQLFERIRGRVDNDVQRESLRGAFRLDLVRFLRRVSAWLGQVLSFGWWQRRTREEPAQITSVRRLYAEMLRWGAASGLPRGSSQTPFEYEQKLCLALPDHGADVALITESYTRARYGAQPPTEAQLQRLKESARRLNSRAGDRARRRPDKPNR